MQNAEGQMPSKCGSPTKIYCAGALGRLFVFLAVSLIPLQVASAAVPTDDNCWRDPSTSVAVPDGGRGACVQQIGPSRIFVQYTRQGMLLAQVDESTSLGLENAADLQFAGNDVDLLYCPVTLLDPLTGAPTSECLIAPGVAGPSALAGTGQIQATATVDFAGSLSCPSSIHIRGHVNTPGGEALQVRSSLLRFFDDDGRSCETIEDHIVVGHLGSASSLAMRQLPPLDVDDGSRSRTPALPQFDTLQLELLEKIANLNDQEFALLVRLASLGPADRELLAHYIETGAAVQISASGRVQAAVADPGAEPIKHSTLGDNIRDVWNILTDINTRRGTGRTAKQVLQDMDADFLLLLNRRTALVAQELRSHTQTIVATVQDMDGQTVSEFARLFGEAFGDLLPFLENLRGDFQAFRGSNCQAGSPCAAFREDLRSFLEESRNNRDRLLSEFGELLHPAFPVNLVQLDATPLQNILDIAPPFALFLMHQALERLAPMWKDIPGVIRDQIPLPLSNTFQSTADIGNATALVENQQTGRLALAVADSVENQPRETHALGLANTVCVRAISRPRLRTAFSGLIIIGNIGEGIAKYINDAACPMDFNLGATGVAVVGAGGGAGAAVTITAHPCRTTATTVANAFGVLVRISTSLREAYDRCEDLDFQSVELEKSLAQCERLVSFQLPRASSPFAVGGYLGDLIDLVELRAWQIEQTGLSVTFGPGFPLEAAKRDLENGHYHTAYGFLCDAYQDLQKSLKDAVRGQQRGRR